MTGFMGGWEAWIMIYSVYTRCQQMTLDIQNPPTDLTLESLAHLAASLERVAAATYCRLATEMQKLHNPDAVDMFKRLVEIEQGYGVEIEHWATNLGLDPQVVTAPEAPENLQHVFTDDKRMRRAATDILLTPWQALNLAVKNEKEAFEFFSALAANADQDDVRQQSEVIAGKKLEHIALLRLERKRAWRTDERARLETIVGRDIPLTLVSFEETTAMLKTALRRRYLDLATEADPLTDDRTATLLRDLAAEVPESKSGHTDFSPLSDGPTHEDVPTILRAALRETEAAFDAFMGVATHAAAEDIVDAAHDEAGQCVTKLERLRDGLSIHIASLTP
jgi:rubrerythrin